MIGGSPVALQVPPRERVLPPGVDGRTVLRDGTEVSIRPVGPADRALVHEFLSRVSLDALALRYFAAVRASVAEEEIVAPDLPSDRLCLLVLTQSGETTLVLGVGEYARAHPGSPRGEVALLVSDRFRRRGVASLLLARLRRAAGAFGMRELVARIRPGNAEMPELLRASGLPLAAERSDDEVDIVFPTDTAV